MKVLKEGKEVKGATVIYDGNGNADLVQVEGVNYAAAAYELKDEEASKKTKPADSKTKNAEVLSIEDVKKK